MFAKIFKWLGFLPALDGLLAETLADWLGWNLPEKLEFVRGRRSEPHIVALLFCALAYAVAHIGYTRLSAPRVATLRFAFGIAALVLLLLSANFLFDIPQQWLTPEATKLRIQLTYAAYVLGYIALGATIADR